MHVIRIINTLSLLVASLFLGTAHANFALSDGCEAVPRRQAVRAEAKCYEVEHDGLKRYLRIYAPSETQAPLPALFVMHGGGGTSGNMEWLTANSFNRIADREGVLVVYPEGIGKGWNDGRRDLRSESVRRNIDDLGYLRALPEMLAANFPIDRKRVYSTGISNGGFMSFRLACDAADVFAAVAPVTANFTVELAPRCKPSRPISVMIVDGTRDPLVPWDGGAIRVLFTNRGDILNVPDTVERWRALNECGEFVAGPLIDAVPDDDTTLKRHVARCAVGTEVVLLEIGGGGHTWPGGVQYLPSWLVGKTSRELEASEAIWQFVGRFSL